MDQRIFNFEVATLEREIERIALPDKAKYFLKTITHLSQDKQNFRGSMQEIAEVMGVAYVTVRRAKDVCLAAGVLEAGREEGKAFAWSINWKVIMSLPDAEIVDRPPTRHRKRIRKPAPTIVRPSGFQPRGVIAQVCAALWSLIPRVGIGAETTQTISVGMDDPAQMSALTPATLLIEGGDSAHLSALLCANERATLLKCARSPPKTPLNPAQMSALMPPSDRSDLTERKERRRGEVKSGSGGEESKASWRELEVSADVFNQGMKALAEFDRLEKLGFFHGVDNARVKYIAFLQALNAQKRKGQVKNIKSYYAKLINNGSWETHPTSVEINTARDWIEKVTQSNAAT